MQNPRNEFADVLSRLEAIESAVADLQPGQRSSARGLGSSMWLLDGIAADVTGDAGGVAYGGHVRVPDGREATWQATYETTELLEDDWLEQELAIKALAHRHRLALVRELLVTPQTALQLAESGRHGTTGQIYNHLRQLVDAGWLATESRGLYGVPTQRVVPLLVVLAATRKEH